MPALDLNPAAMPSILSLLMPGTASAAAPVGEGAPPDFTALIAGLTAAEPSAPGAAAVPTTGIDLPVERPELAAPAAPAADEVDIAEVMVGCGWTPGPLPKLPPAAGSAAVVDAPTTTDGEADPQEVAPQKPRIKALLFGSQLSMQHPNTMPVAPAIPGRVALLATAARPIATARPASPLALEEPLNESEARPDTEASAPSLPSVPEPVPAATPTALPPQPVSSQAADVQLPIAHDTAGVEVRAAPQLPASRVIAPEPWTVPADRLQPQLPPPSPPLATGAAPADLRIAPEIARQVAQMIQPAPETGSEAPLEPVAHAPLPIPQIAPQAPAAPAPTPPVQLAHAAPIDLGRAEWMQAMIDRIAELPQAEGRREAQIRLLPDALGAVQVKLVQRDEQMHVTLTSDNVQARQLLIDATPRLHELAEARGLRFAQPEVGGGQSQDRRSAPDQQNSTPTRPRSAAADADSETSTDGDRIA